MSYIWFLQLFALEIVKFSRKWLSEKLETGVVYFLYSADNKNNCCTFFMVQGAGAWQIMER